MKSPPPTPYGLKGEGVLCYNVFMDKKPRHSKVRDIDAEFIECSVCGIVKSVVKQNRRRCSVAVAQQRYKRTPEGKRIRYEGEKRKNNGYVQVYTSDGWKREHRLVMESIIGRPLLAEETVHHINGIRSDNRAENLELWSKSHPAGQRVSDLVSWAEEILKTYKL